MKISDKGKGRKSPGSNDRRSTLPGSTRPYLIRAIYEWAIDNGLTPQIRVNTTFKDVVVPLKYVKEDQIVLNVHPQSVKALQLGNHSVMCSARFSGQPFEIRVPILAVMAIYARENGVGIVFQDDDTHPSRGVSRGLEKPPADNGKSGGKPDSSSHLKLVK